MALIVAVAFALGFATTVAEPDVLVLAQQVDAASQGAIKQYVILYVIALAIGLSSVLAGRSAVSDGFGLLGFASIGPIAAVLLMGLLLR